MSDDVELVFEKLKVRAGSPIKVNGKEGEIEAITVEPPPGVSKRVIIRMLAPIATLATITLAIGLYPRPLYVLAEREPPPN